MILHSFQTQLLFIYIYIYVCVCVCMCVRARACFIHLRECIPTSRSWGLTRIVLNSRIPAERWAWGQQSVGKSWTQLVLVPGIIVILIWYIMTFYYIRCVQYDILAFSPSKGHHRQWNLFDRDETIHISLINRSSPWQKRLWKLGINTHTHTHTHTYIYIYIYIYILLGEFIS